MGPLFFTWYVGASFCTSLLKSYYSISVVLRFLTLHLFLLYAFGYWLSAVLGIIVLLHDPITDHLKLLDRWSYICLKNIIEVLLLSEWLLLSQVLWLHNKPESSSLHPICLTFSMRCLCSCSICGAVYDDQTSLSWSHFYKSHQLLWFI